MACINSSRSTCAEPARRMLPYHLGFVSTMGLGVAHATMAHAETHTWIYLADLGSPKRRVLKVSPFQMMIFRSYLTYPSHLNIVCRATGLKSSNLSTQWIQIMLKQIGKKRTPREPFQAFANDTLKLYVDPLVLQLCYCSPLLQGKPE